MDDIIKKSEVIMELDEKQLESAIGGNSQKMGEETAKMNPELFRQKKIEELKKLKADLGQDEELSEEELAEIQAGFSR